VRRGISNLKALQILEVVDVRGTSTRAIEELGKLSELWKISVTTNGASDKKCKAFCEAVQKLPSLRSLSISSGGFGSPWGTLEWICSTSSLPPLQRILLAGPIRLIPGCVISHSCRVGLNQLVRFLVVELTYLGSNHRFDMDVTFMANYFFSRRRRPYRQ
jgi:hypothetical protein